MQTSRQFVAFLVFDDAVDGVVFLSAANFPHSIKSSSSKIMASQQAFILSIDSSLTA